MVGIDEYSGAPLSGCVNDATRMQSILSRNQDGSPNFNCQTLLAPSDRVNTRDLREKISELFAHEADAALFYFSGHGFLAELGGYLVTQDAGKYEEGVPMGEVITLASNARIGEVVVILDCCHSGAFGQIPALNSEGAFLREGVSILTASRASQVSIETGGAGLFTSLICDALESGAADVCGNVTVASVYAYIDQALGAWDQRPMFKSHVSRLASLRKCEPEIDLAIIRQLPKYFSSPTSELHLDPSYEPDASPKDEEHEAIFSNLQRLRACRLVVPVGEDHMYYAAMRSKSCKLTPLGRHYWTMANDGQL